MNAAVGFQDFMLLEKLATIFDVKLFQIDGKVRGFINKKSTPLSDLWVVQQDVTLCVDERSEKLVTAFVRVAKNLWFYAVVTPTGQWLLAFDGDRAKIRAGHESAFGLGNSINTLAKLKGSVTAAFTFTDNKWVPTDSKLLMEP